MLTWFLCTIENDPAVDCSGLLTYVCTHVPTRQTKTKVCAQMDELMEEQRDDNMSSMVASLSAGSRRR